MRYPKSEVAEILERFVRAEGRVLDEDPDFNRDVDLFTSGYLDSLGTMHLISYIEREFTVSSATNCWPIPRSAQSPGSVPS